MSVSLIKGTKCAHFSFRFYTLRYCNFTKNGRIVIVIGVVTFCTYQLVLTSFFYVTTIRAFDYSHCTLQSIKLLIMYVLFLRFFHLLFQVRIEATRLKIIYYYFIAIFTDNNYFSNNAWN